MNKTELLKYHEYLCQRGRDIMEKKNHDYSGADGSTPFANFEMVEKFGVASTSQGFFTRITDKLSRIATFIRSGILLVKDESFEDSVVDIINYMVLFAAYIKSKKQNERKPTRSSIS